ncbi:hypothetical protein GIB67_001026 [Kingdonia uniflora]|uniref:Uncharacterized protein n=1 Tax=Kingdonia uniflora TaxID=39325 RepID=A0A7J7MFW1_9MAGN|nr:hypothetical protein GIB67_001026 [Kingdonia uniflora]
MVEATQQLYHAPWIAHRSTSTLMDRRIYARVLKVSERELLNIDSGVVSWAPENNWAITAVAFAYSGVNLVSASEDGTARIWDTESNQVIKFSRTRGEALTILS